MLWDWSFMCVSTIGFAVLMQAATRIVGQWPRRPMTMD